MFVAIGVLDFDVGNTCFKNEITLHSRSRVVGSVGVTFTTDGPPASYSVGRQSTNAISDSRTLFSNYINNPTARSTNV